MAAALVDSENIKACVWCLGKLMLSGPDMLLSSSRPSKGGSQPTSSGTNVSVLNRLHLIVIRVEN